MSVPNDERATMGRVATLLTAILVLLVLLVGGMGIGAALAWREYSKAQEALGATRNLEEAARASREVAEELTKRQAILSTFLKQRAEQVNKDMKDIRKRRDDLGEIQKGPLQKADQALQFIQVLSDQVFLLNRQITEIQAGVGEAMKPLPSVKERLDAHDDKEPESEKKEPEKKAPKKEK
jgi:hypothetical protein